jgi:uncharacterized protein YecE (DUF72 family)
VPAIIGTSGWMYDGWRESFYPKGCPKSKWLEYYASFFATVESNAAFYRLPERTTFESWASRTPEGFVMSVKVSRYLTHVRRLQEPAEPVARLMERSEGLGEKAAAYLVQLPPNLRADLDSLAATLKCFPGGARVAVEPRHPSWFSDELRRLLERHDAALCIADSLGRRSPLWRTASWGYVRFHAGRAAPQPCYGRKAIANWADRVVELYEPGDDVYCYFNNDASTCAPRNAGQLIRALARRGHRPS